MIPYCVDVLQGRVPESNERKITKLVAIILLAHYLGDIHQPLHVGAEYFDDQGHVVDPDKQKYLEDQGGNTITVQLADDPTHRKKLHGFWDMDTVAVLLPQISNSMSKDQKRETSDAGVDKLAHEMAAQEPKDWRLPSTLKPRDYAEAWADEIMPLAVEAHARLQFKQVHPQQEEFSVIATGLADEKPAADHVSYREWSSKVVRNELHKAGWRLADLLEKSVTSTSTISAAPAPAATPNNSPPPTPPLTSPPPTPPEILTVPSPAASTSVYGTYPANYKEIIIAWMNTRALDTLHIDWQADPKPADLPSATGRGHDYGYLVIFNTRATNRSPAHTYGVLIRDGKIINASAFGK